jgi:hypothetical protein
VHIADFDGDGFSDLAVTQNSLLGDRVVVLLNDGYGSFHESSQSMRLICLLRSRPLT